MPIRHSTRRTDQPNFLPRVSIEHKCIAFITTFRASVAAHGSGGSHGASRLQVPVRDGQSVQHARRKRSRRCLRSSGVVQRAQTACTELWILEE